MTEIKYREVTNHVRKLESLGYRSSGRVLKDKTMIKYELFLEKGQEKIKLYKWKRNEPDASNGFSVFSDLALSFLVDKDLL